MALGTTYNKHQVWLKGKEWVGSGSVVPASQVEKIGLFGIHVHKHRLPLLALREALEVGERGGWQVGLFVQSDRQRDIFASDLFV